MATKAISPDKLWLAVVGRDCEAEFLFGVTSTGVYCRPGCPARTPSRNRVRYFADAEAAKSAGFRACRRCHPEELGEHPEAVARARELLERAPGMWTSEPLAAEVGLSPSQLQRQFKRVFGISPAEYSRAVRTQRARSALAGASPVTEVLYDSGFGSSRAFYEVVPAALGMTPTQFRKGGAGVEIRYTLFESFLGPLLVGVTDRGVCSVKMGDRDQGLEEQLREEFSSARLTRDEAGLSDVREAALSLAAGRADRPALPLDVHGTVFQWLVWRQIQRIPRGRTKTYGELAREIGRPTAARAVARACATNQVALLIPCHRVLPAAGGEGGYRWGKDRKQRLLAAEAAGS
jgi:AraC family transcriptional regulator of adaptative response/methylated-DNA-[protein]-cysteine methyltransferase